MSKAIFVWDGTQFVPANVPVGAVPNAVGSYNSITPTNPKIGQIWFDTNTSPATIKVYTGIAWSTVGGTQVNFDDDQNILANRIFG
jgi:hypothetical protein